MLITEIPKYLDEKNGRDSGVGTRSSFGKLFATKVNFV